MWRYDRPPTYPTPDLEQLVEQVNSHHDFFKLEEGLDPSIYIGRAPGRLDVMGGIADYSGSLVLELPMAVGTAVAAQPIAALQFEVLSPEVAASGAEPLVSLPLSSLLSPGDGPYYLTARKLLANDPKRSWRLTWPGCW